MQIPGSATLDSGVSTREHLSQLDPVRQSRRAQKAPGIRDQPNPLEFDQEVNSVFGAGNPLGLDVGTLGPHKEKVISVGAYMNHYFAVIKCNL